MLFDPEYTSKRVQVDLTNVSLYDALRIIGTITGTFWRPITANTIDIAALSFLDPSDAIFRFKALSAHRHIRHQQFSQSNLV